MGGGTTIKLTFMSQYMKATDWFRTSDHTCTYRNGWILKTAVSYGGTTSLCVHVGVGSGGVMSGGIYYGST